jgi:hypothetical protein
MFRALILSRTGYIIVRPITRAAADANPFEIRPVTSQAWIPFRCRRRRRIKIEDLPFDRVMISARKDLTRPFGMGLN